MRNLFRIIPLLYFVLTSSCWAQESLDGYYSSDLLDAVHEAKTSAHHYDYSNTYRYKRTTSQSIELNRMNLDEMDDTTLEGTLDKQVMQQTESADVILTLDDQDRVSTYNENKNISSDQLNPINGVPSGRAISHSNNGTLLSEGVINNGSLVSTPRP